MARLWYTGFETGGTEWNGGQGSAGATVAITSTQRRTGTYSLGISAASTTGFIRQVFDNNQTTLYGRLAIRLDSVASSRSFTMVSFRDSNNATQFNLYYDGGTNTMEWRNGAGTVLGSGFVIIPAETWMVLEFEVIVSGSGSLTLKTNGTTSSTYSGNTDLTGAGNVRSIYLQLANGVGTGNVWFDDIAINNAEGSYQNSYAGLGGVFYLYPTADGAQNDWAPSAGTVNYEMVDERPPDNATTFNQALDTASIDLYEVDDCPEYIAAINCLQVAYRAALVTSGYNELTDLVRVGTVNYSGTEHTIVPITPSFTYYLGTIHYLNPSSGSAWGTVEVNAMQAGIEITT